MMRKKKPTKAHRARTKGRGRPKERVRDKVDLKKVKRLTEAGLTDKQLALAVDLSESSINRYKKDPEFLTVLKKGKDKADQRVVHSLWARANGINYKEVTSEFKGAKLVVTKVVGKWTPPDTTACIFWLCNRDKENWKHRYALEGIAEHPIPFRLVFDGNCDRD